VALTLQLRRQDCVIVANHPVGVECDACSLGGSLLLVLSWAVVNVVVDVIVAMKRTMVACLMVICIFNC